MPIPGAQKNKVWHRFFVVACSNTLDGTSFVACFDDTLMGVSKCPSLLFVQCNSCCWLEGVVTCRAVDVVAGLNNFRSNPL